MIPCVEFILSISPLESSEVVVNKNFMFWTSKKITNSLISKKKNTVIILYNCTSSHLGL